VARAGKWLKLVEHLSSKHEALSSNASTYNNNNKKKKKERKKKTAIGGMVLGGSGELSFVLLDCLGFAILTEIWGQLARRLRIYKES
jgi:hypothetical protein